MSRRYVGGDDFQYAIDRELEEYDIDAHRARMFDEYCAAERAKVDGRSHVDEFGATDCFGGDRT